MTELILVFCLATSALSCAPGSPIEVPIPGVEISACLGSLGAQETAAEWLREHPKYRLTGWKCRIGPPPGKTA
jgi:hypothetical protein